MGKRRTTTTGKRALAGRRTTTGATGMTMTTSSMGRTTIYPFNNMRYQRCHWQELHSGRLIIKFYCFVVSVSNYLALGVVCLRIIGAIHVNQAGMAGDRPIFVILEVSMRPRHSGTPRCALLTLSLMHSSCRKYSASGLPPSPLKKVHHMLGYQIELCYELALSPDMNASGNSGFESVLGIVSSIK